jgi:UDP-N-acetylglucosamine 2-epimerase
VRVISVVGARPQFVKASPVSQALREAGHTELLVHSGQHYDFEMSRLFFEQLPLPQPQVNLEVGSGPPGWQVAEMLKGLETLLQAERPDWVVVYGDTNTTLAGALAAVKAGRRLAHVEAGLRSFNRGMPEEHNRVLTDHCSDLLLCPTRTATQNLAREGLATGARLVGDTMYDAVLQFSGVALERSTLLARLGLLPGGYLLATLHRPYNTDDPQTLTRIIEGLGGLGESVVLPLHPRTRGSLEAAGLGRLPGSIRVIPPVGYLDMLALERQARVILTDSGGVQKEAFFFKVPCVTLRPETEWVETVEAGYNVLVGSDPVAMADAVRRDWRLADPPCLFGEGRAAQAIVRALAAEVRPG